MRQYCDSAPFSSLRGRHIHHPPAQRDVERISTEQINRCDEDKKGGSFPTLWGFHQLRFSEYHDQNDRKRDQRSHSVDNTKKAVGARRQAEGYRDELKG